MTVYIMIAVTKDKPERKGEAGLIGGDSGLAVQRVSKCHEPKGRIRAAELMRILGVMEERGR